MATKINMPEMIRMFEAYQAEINTGLDNVKELLRAQEYTEAAQVMNTISTRQAKTSVMIRSALVKAGLIQEGT